MPIDPVALASEVNNDPVALGYATPKAAGNDQAVADLLNQQRAGGAFAANREPVSVAVLFAAVDATEFLALSALKLAQLQCVLAAGTIDLNDPQTRGILLGIFPNPGNTRTNIGALLKRTGSRAEVLFGRGVVVTAGDVSFALRGAR